MSQNFSKVLIKDGKIKWFPARTTKVVCPRPSLAAVHNKQRTSQCCALSHGSLRANARLGMSNV